MSFPRYPAYKPSGVEWLGEVPEHWGILPVKRLASLQSGTGITSDSISEDATYPVFGGNGVRGFSDSFTHEGYYPIIGRQGALCGNINYATGRFWASEHAVVVSPAKHCEVRWLGETLRAMNLNQYSTSAAQPGLSVEMINTLMVPCPPQKEQAAIATFLVRETAKIDALIAEQQRLIELLQEKRQAVISHAVSKGLNPDVPLKDSGVEWLGEVPEHWDLKRGRFLYKKREEETRDTDEVVTAFRDGQVIQRSLRRTDGFTLAELEVGYQHVCVGDLVIHGMDAFAGAIGVSESEGKCTPEYSVCRPIDQRHANDYFANALRVMARRDYIYVICPSVRERAPRFRFQTFKDVTLPVPPSGEQASIAKAIKGECSKLSELANSAESLVAILQERRSALISAAVTGQIDVRGLAPGADAA